MASGYSCNDNQNYFVMDGRTTSRVLQNPGGKTTLTLGWSNERTHKIVATPPKKVAAPTIERVEIFTPVEKKQNRETSTDNPLNFGVSSNAFACGSNMNSGNVITNRPTSRVLNPPGGSSSLSRLG